MITLTTGVPGSGKTLYTIAQVVAKVEAENKALEASGQEPRPVYYSGISDLKLPWIELEDATEWDSLPVGSIIVIDECQRVFRPRGSGSTVPAYIAALETHRHKGYDIFLVTQHPMLVDQNIRRLVGQHWHVVRKFGLPAATIHEWGSVHEITQRNLLQAVRRQFKYSKEIYGYYKSAELHTHKAKIPARVWFLLAAPLLIGLLGYYGYQKAFNVGKTETKPETTAGTNASPERKPGPMTKAEYYASAEARIPGLYYTAPKYDEITTPVDAPFPTACMISKGFDRETGRSFDKCGCIDQQGNRYSAGDSLCRNIALNGIFKEWGQQQHAGPARDESAAKRTAQPDRPGLDVAPSAETATPAGGLIFIPPAG